MTFHSLALYVQISRIPPLIRAISFRIYYRAAGSYTRSTTYRTPVSQNSSLEYSYTISSRITRNTTYTIYMRAEGEYTWCYYNDLLGENSDSVQVTTLAVGKPVIIFESIIIITAPFTPTNEYYFKVPIILTGAIISKNETIFLISLKLIINLVYANNSDFKGGRPRPNTF